MKEQEVPKLPQEGDKILPFAFPIFKASEVSILCCICGALDGAQINRSTDQSEKLYSYRRPQ